MINLNLDSYQPRKGDVILLRGTVRYDMRDDSNGVSVDVEGTYATAHIQRKDIAGVEKLEFQKGDRVDALGRTGTILAIVGSFAWIDTGTKDHPPFTAPLTNMVRALEPPRGRAFVEEEAAPPGEEITL